MQEEKKPFRPELQAALAAYRDRHELTLKDLAGELASNPAQVSQYLSGTPVGDVGRLEAIIEDVLKNETRRRESKHELFDCPIAKSFRGACETIRETNDVGLIFGPAGIGKTCACSLYVEANPTVIFITATAWRNVGTDVEAMIFNAISTRGWKGNVKRGDWVCDRLKGSNRLLIVDNAHKLRESGLAWIFDFHDVTGCPVVLVGNPEVETAIRRNDQQFSRIGLKRVLRVKPGQSEALANKIVESLVPEAAKGMGSIPEVVAEKDGHFRAVRKLTLLARKVRENGENKNWSDCARSAHSQLVRDYAL